MPGLCVCALGRAGRRAGGNLEFGPNGLKKQFCSALHFHKETYSGSLTVTSLSASRVHMIDHHRTSLPISTKVGMRSANDRQTFTFIMSPIAIPSFVQSQCKNVGNVESVVAAALLLWSQQPPRADFVASPTDAFQFVSMKPCKLKSVNILQALLALL